MKTGVLLIHGFLGHPAEYDGLSQFLQEHGYPTLAIHQPAHGDDRHYRQVKDCTASDITQAIQVGFDRLKQHTEQVVVLGHSLGGTGALTWAGQAQPEALQGIITLGSPYSQGYWVNAPGRFVRHLARDPLGYGLKGARFAGRSFTPNPKPLFLPWWHGHLRTQAGDLFSQLHASLPLIKTPVLLMHAPLDWVVPYDQMERLACGLSQAPVQTIALDNAGHQIFPFSPAVETVQHRVLDFLKALAHVNH